MSTISRAHRIQLTIAVATLAVALLGGIASAFAQTAGGGGRGGGAGSGGPDQTAVIVYGTPGNCPPTVACGEPHRRPERPQVGKLRRIDRCGDFQPGSRLYNQCRKEL